MNLCHGGVRVQSVSMLAQESEELFETVSQALLSGQDRDCLAGWGAVVYVM